MLGRLRPRISYANVAATIALVLALGGGAVYASSKSKAKVKLGQLAFPLKSAGSWADSPIAGTGGFQTVLTKTVKVTGKGGNLLAQLAVETDNTANDDPTNVTLRMLMNGTPEEGVFTTTVPALGSGTGLALILCDGFSPGTYTLTLQAMSSDGPATFMDRTLSVEALPG